MGIFYGGNGKLLGRQILGITVLLSWAAFFSFICFYSLKLLGLLRVPDEEQQTVHVRFFVCVCFSSAVVTGVGVLVLQLLTSNVAADILKRQSFSFYASKQASRRRLTNARWSMRGTAGATGR